MHNTVWKLRWKLIEDKIAVSGQRGCCERIHPVHDDASYVPLMIVQFRLNACVLLQVETDRGEVSGIPYTLELKLDPTLVEPRDLELSTISAVLRG